MRLPVVLIGNGCRGNPGLVEGLCSIGVPVLTTWQAIDLVPEAEAAFCGRPGVIGQRAANIIIQKSTELYVFGAKLDAETVGWNLDNFAPRAHKVAIDCDEAELGKLPASWEKIRKDLSGGVALPAPIEPVPEWMLWCMALYLRFRRELAGGDGRPVDPYYFVSVLSEVLPDGAMIVPGSSGMQSCAMMQAFRVKRGQRVMLCNTIGSMGMEPMAIGAAIASGKPVVVVTGDGGFGLNIQELEVVRRECLPIKYFVFSNGGYGSVVNMQDDRFHLRVGSDAPSGLTVLNWRGAANMFGFPYYCMRSGRDMLMSLGDLLDQQGPAIIEVASSLDFKYACKMGSHLVGNRFVLDNLEDMTPKIPDLAELMEWGMNG